MAPMKSIPMPAEPARAAALLALGLVLSVTTAAGARQEGAAAAVPGAPETPHWPFFRGDPALTGVASCTLPDEIGLVWSFAAGGAVTSSPVVAEGRVHFGSDDGKLYALDFETGALLWAFETQDIIEAPPLVLEGTVFVGSSDYFLYALDAATGELRWKTETDDRVLGSANWFAGEDGRARIVVGSYDTNLYCFDAASGERVWTYKTDNYVNGTPAILGDRIVFGGCDSALHVVSAASGEGLSRIELGAECYVAGSVALKDGKVYFGHYGNAFVCVDLETGAPDWVITDPRHPFFSSPALGADKVVFGGRDKALHCADQASGEELWAFKTRRKVDGSPVIAGDRVVFGSGDGRIYVLALESGEELWSYDLGDSVFTSPAVTAGRFLFGCNDGSVYAFGAAPKESE